MKKLFKKLLIKSTAILCSAMLLFLSPCAGYIDASSIQTVYASDWAIVGGGVAADAILEFLIGLLGSVAAKEAYEKHEEEIKQSIYDYISAPDRWADLIGESVEDTCVKIYDKASNTIHEVSWEDVLEGLHEFHDEAVDDLTGIYVKYCPQLLDICNDFVGDVLSGDIVIPELSTELIDATFSDYESIRNVDGTYNFYGFYSWFANPTFVGHEVFYQRIYMGTVKSKPFAYVNENGDQYRLCVLRSLNSSSWYSEQSYSGTTYMDGVFSAKHSTKFIYCDSTQYGFGVNCPLFSSLDAAKDAFISDDFSDALNFIDKTMESVIDLTDIPDLAPDIPPFTKSWRQGELERLLNSPDATGIGSYGRGVSADNWGNDTPWIGLESLGEYSRSLDDIYRQMIDDIINGTYDSAKGIPGTYSEAWEQAISEAWDNIVEQSETVPGEKDKPADGDEDEKDDPEEGGGGSGGSNNDQEEPPEGGDDNSDFDMDKLTRSQQRSVRTIQNIIEDHLTESDLSGALEELEGNPIERPDGGFWNHVQEVKDAYTGLLREIQSLEGSLQNPNLDPEVHFFLQYIYDTACEYIHIIEEMFEPYGGIN